uniref:Uncharacterized protein AlNc14C6G874 n=1 Tax=Albugo laibachii Nc14 TaxID=890382 RepID=F0W1A5_9STRA|nr:conserved hypothetical protein [Albugo laibachii Nc14]|eukprot:CCA14832.1 conserved hypothetical protein [Albugo laibachii Nc14]
MEAKGRSFHIEDDPKKASKMSSDDESAAHSDSDEPGAPTSRVVALRHGYNQTYIIRSSDTTMHEVLFRCGNWCYSGTVDLGNTHIDRAHVPVVIPALQKQQSSLKYLCDWKSMPSSSFYTVPLETLYDALDFIGEELASLRIEKKLIKAAKEFSWIDNEDLSAGTRNFFELQTGGYECFDGIDLIATKTFVRGLVLVVIYSLRSYFIVLQEGDGEQPLLDVRFPDLSAHLQGVHLQSYREDDCTNMKKLTLWQALSNQGTRPMPKSVQLACKDVSGKGYNQTFLIRKPSSHSGGQSNLREVLFRFGSWCYNGHIDLGPKLQLADIPVIIPLLRRQQSALTFMCEASKMPATSLFTPSMEYLVATLDAIREELSNAEQYIQNSSQCPVASEWINSDDYECFFELTMQKCPALQDIEAVASKVYMGDIVLVLIYFDYNVYVYIEASDEEQALLDTHFPDITFQKEGVQLMTYQDGVPGCPDLQRMTLWKIVMDLVDSDASDEDTSTNVHPLDVSDTMKADSKSSQSRSEDALKDEKHNECDIDDQLKKVKDVFRPRTISRPHHIGPLKESKIAQVSRKLMNETSHEVAPWDKSGRPLPVTTKK